MEGESGRFVFLGRVEIQGPLRSVAVRGVQPALVLANLVLEHPRPLLRDHMIELLWGQETLAVGHSTGVIRQVVSRARSALVTAGLPETALVSSGGSTVLDVDVLRSDVIEMIQAVGDAQEALSRGEPDRARVAAVGAVSLSRLPLLPGCEGAWVDRWRDRLRGFRQRALWAASSALLGVGDPAGAAELAEEALAVSLADEQATRLLMAAHVAAGDRGKALAVYERCRRLLDDELGVRPSDATEAAYLSILGEAPEARRRPARSPGPLMGTAQDVSSRFVGRRAEIGAIDELWAQAKDGGLQVVSIEGEPGIGKTGLARELARRARIEGCVVVWGRCSANTGTALQPFDDLCAQLVEDSPELLKQGDVDPDALVGAVGAAPLPPTPDDTVRARVFRSVCRLFASAADKPLIVVIDDIHWGRPTSLALLQEVLWEVRDRRCLVVMTLRTAPGPLAEALFEIQRRHSLTTYSLQGLSVEEIGELLDAGAVRLREDSHSVAKVIAERTAGNPLYVTQLIESAGRSSEPLDPRAIPAAVSQLLQRRIATLDLSVASILRLAAVAGPRFDLATLEGCSAVPNAELLNAVEELCRLRLLEELHAERFAFVHELVRDSVLSGLSATRRRRLHARFAEILAKAAAEPVVVAHHLLAAGPLRAAEATPWLLAAGDAALAKGSWTVALEHFAGAERVSPDEASRGAALIGTGRARRGLGDLRGARLVLDEALGLARSSGLASLAAAATLALVGGGGRGVATEMPDGERTLLLRRAVDGLGPDEPALLVPALGELALSLVLTDEAEERARLCDRCVDVARLWGDSTGIAQALHTRRIALMGPRGTEFRIADGLEALGNGPGLEQQIAARLGLVEDWLETGDLSAAAAALDIACDQAVRFGHPYWQWAAKSWQALIAIVLGRLEEAESAAFDAYGHQPPDHPEAMAALGVQLVNVRLFQGRAGEMVDMLKMASAENPHIPCYGAVLALCCAEAGQLEAASEVYTGFAQAGFNLPPDSNWLLGVCVLADCCATLGDPDGAAALAARLQPWAERHAVLNCYGGGGAWWGPVAHHLGRLAAVQGDVDTARSRLQQAVLASRRAGAPQYEERSQAALATLDRLGVRG